MRRQRAGSSGLGQGRAELIRSRTLSALQKAQSFATLDQAFREVDDTLYRAETAQDLEAFVSSVCSTSSYAPVMERKAAFRALERAAQAKKGLLFPLLPRINAFVSRRLVDRDVAYGDTQYAWDVAKLYSALATEVLPSSMPLAQLSHLTGPLSRHTASESEFTEFAALEALGEVALRCPHPLLTPETLRLARVGCAVFLRHTSDRTGRIPASACALLCVLLRRDPGVFRARFGRAGETLSAISAAGGQSGLQSLREQGQADEAGANASAGDVSGGASGDAAPEALDEIYGRDSGTRAAAAPPATLGDAVVPGTPGTPGTPQRPSRAPGDDGAPLADGLKASHSRDSHDLLQAGVSPRTQRRPASSGGTPRALGPKRARSSPNLGEAGAGSQQAPGRQPDRPLLASDLGIGQASGLGSSPAERERELIRTMVQVAELATEAAAWKVRESGFLLIQELARVGALDARARQRLRACTTKHAYDRVRSVRIAAERAAHQLDEDAYTPGDAPQATKGSPAAGTTLGGPESALLRSRMRVTRERHGESLQRITDELDALGAAAGRGSRRAGGQDGKGGQASENLGNQEGEGADAAGSAEVTEAAGAPLVLPEPAHTSLEPTEEGPADDADAAALLRLLAQNEPPIRPVELGDLRICLVPACRGRATHDLEFGGRCEYECEGPACQAGASEAPAALVAPVAPDDAAGVSATPAGPLPVRIAPTPAPAPEPHADLHISSLTSSALQPGQVAVSFRQPSPHDEDASAFDADAPAVDRERSPVSVAAPAEDPESDAMDHFDVDVSSSLLKGALAALAQKDLATAYSLMIDAEAYGEVSPQKRDKDLLELMEVTGPCLLNLPTDLRHELSAKLAGLLLGGVPLEKLINWVRQVVMDRVNLRGDVALRLVNGVRLGVYPTHPLWDEAQRLIKELMAVYPHTRPAAQ